jgi:hypothetical protein
MGNIAYSSRYLKGIACGVPHAVHIERLSELSEAGCSVRCGAGLTNALVYEVKKLSFRSSHLNSEMDLVKEGFDYFSASGSESGASETGGFLQG